MVESTIEHVLVVVITNSNLKKWGKKPNSLPGLHPHFQGQSPSPQYEEENANTSAAVLGQLKCAD